MSDLSVEEAKDFVKYVRTQRGGFSEKLKQETPKEVLDALSAIRRQLAGSIRM